MLSIKEYADKQGVSKQAIYQSLKSQENLERLKDHIFLENGRKMLDDYAVKVLDESRIVNPVVVMQEEKNERIEELTSEVKKLTAALIEQQKIVIEKQEYIQELQNRLLEEKNKAMELSIKESEISALNAKIEDIEQLLKYERGRTWLDKLFKR